MHEGGMLSFSKAKNATNTPECPVGCLKIFRKFRVYIEHRYVSVVAD